MRSSAKSIVALVSTLAGVALVLYARNLFGGETFVGRDHLTMVTPARDFMSEAIASGRIPQWWDGVGMGTPFAANPIYGALYPLTWIATLAAGSLGADLVVVLHVVLLGVGVASWSRRLGASPVGAMVGGTIAMSCGYTASMAVNGVPLMTLAWLPWVASATDALCTASSRRARIRAALVCAAIWAMTLLSGDPAGAISAGLLAIAVVATRSEKRLPTFGLVAAAMAAGLLLASVSILPALQLLAESGRAGGVDAAEATSWSMHPLRMLEWIWPQALGDASEMRLNLASVIANSSTEEGFGSGWSISLFISLPVLVFAFTAGFRSLAWASLVFVLLALGSYTPLYGLYRAVFIPEQVIRYPERHLAGAVVIWSALAGVGFGKAMQVAPSVQALKRWGGALAILVALTILALALGGVAQESLGADALARGVQVEAAWSKVVFGGGLAAVCLAMLVGALWLRRQKRYARAGYALALVGLLLPLARESMYAQPVVPRGVVSGPPSILTPALQRVEQSPVRPRLYRHALVNPYMGESSSAVVFASQYQTAMPNTATSAGFAYVPGYEASMGTRLRATWEYSTEFGTRLLQLFDIEFAYMPRTVAEAKGLQIVHSVITPKLVLARQALRRPRAFVAERWRHVPNQEAALAVLFGASMDLGAVTVIGEGEGGGEARAVPGPPPPCEIDSERPERVRLQCTSDNGGYAVLLDAYHPGWTARVDGTRAELVIVDAVVRGVKIPEGAHTVIYEYQTPGLALGFWLSCLSWGFLGLGFFAVRRREKSSSGTA